MATKLTSFVSEHLTHHSYQLAVSVKFVTGLIPPKVALLSEREGHSPCLATSLAAGFSVPHKSGEGPVAYPWEVENKR